MDRSRILPFATMYQELDVDSVDSILSDADKAYLTVAFEIPKPVVGTVDPEDREYVEVVESFEITDL